MVAGLQLPMNKIKISQKDKLLNQNFMLEHNDSKYLEYWVSY